MEVEERRKMHRRAGGRHRRPQLATFDIRTGARTVGPRPRRVFARADLLLVGEGGGEFPFELHRRRQEAVGEGTEGPEIGRASCRERVLDHV